MNKGKLMGTATIKNIANTINITGYTAINQPLKN
jgi:hypothetical protein